MKFIAIYFCAIQPPLASNQVCLSGFLYQLNYWTMNKVLALYSKRENPGGASDMTNYGYVFNKNHL